MKPVCERDLETAPDAGRFTPRKLTTLETLGATIGLLGITAAMFGLIWVVDTLVRS
jgi:hypothetical protein